MSMQFVSRSKLLSFVEIVWLHFFVIAEELNVAVYKVKVTANKVKIAADEVKVAAD